MQHISVEDVSRIALLFLNGDDFEQVLIDRIGHTDYDFDRFNRLRAVLFKVEKIAPELKLSAILWSPYPTNNRVGTALVAGGSLPVEGCKRQKLNPDIRRCLLEESAVQKARPGGLWSLYSPVRNSRDDVVGVLELLVGLGEGEKIDVSCMDMFVAPREEEEE
ncbi:MAG: hypothetical protein ACK5LX_04370 [Oscillospiraceae bacterium]